MSVVRCLLSAALLGVALQTWAEPVPRIAIIIDDLGYQYGAGQRAINLPGPVSYAILPGTPSGRALAREAHEKGKEVLLHLPLESVGHQGPAEPGGITLDMSQRALHEAFAQALESVPFAIGVSSHRGSLLTRHPGHMHWLMQEIRRREGLFFVDSYTTSASVALQLAAESGVAAMRRHVFLDHDRSPAALDREFDRLARIARQRGVALAIGHPYPETLSFLERKLATLDSAVLRLVPVSQVLSGVEPAPANTL